MAGWFKVQRDGERTTIEIDRSEIRSDARQAIERGREFLERRDREYADQQYAQQQFSGQAQQQNWPQEQVASQPQPWGTTYDPGQQPNSGGALQQVQYYDDGNIYLPFNPVQANPYPPQR